MNLRIYSRSLFIKNIILFVLLSFVFAFFIENYKHPQIFNDFSLFKIYIEDNIFLSAMTSLLILSIFFVLKWSKQIFFLYSLGIFLYALNAYFQSDSPAILPLSLIYMMCSYYFYSLFREELQGAAYVPNFDIRDLNPVLNQKLKVTITQKDTTFDGYIVNLDTNSLFVYLSGKVKLNGRILMEVELDGTKFCFEGIVVSSYNNSYGIKVSKVSHQESFSWGELYQIMVDRGYHLLQRNA